MYGEYIDELARWTYNDIIPTHELIIQYKNGGIEVDFGDNEKLLLNFPDIFINTDYASYPHIQPEDLISFEGEIIGRSLHDLSMERVAVVDWTVYSDDWDHEQWTVLSWEIVQRNSEDEKRRIEYGIDIRERTQRLLEEQLSVNNI